MVSAQWCDKLISVSHAFLEPWTHSKISINCKIGMLQTFELIWNKFLCNWLCRWIQLQTELLFHFTWYHIFIYFMCIYILCKHCFVLSHILWHGYLITHIQNCGICLLISDLISTKQNLNRTLLKLEQGCVLCPKGNFTCDFLSMPSC